MVIGHSIHIPKIFQVFTVFRDQVYTRGDFSGFLTDAEHFGKGFVLSFTRRCMNPKKIVLVWSRTLEILNLKA